MSVEWFQSVMPTQEQANDLFTKEQAFTELVAGLDKLLPAGRAKALTMTKLEEASMWASKAIVQAAK